MNDKFKSWLNGDMDPMEDIVEAARLHDSRRKEMKSREKHLIREFEESENGQMIIRAERKGFYFLYTLIAIISCITLIGVLLYTVANLPRYGNENPRTVEVVQRYVEDGLEETGAINIVSGMILDYRAFDTLGESHVLFTALICVIILLRKDKKNMAKQPYDDYHTIRRDSYHDISKDPIMRTVGLFLLPSIMMYGIYVLVNGQNGPGGGFSGGAVIGAGLIIFASSYGFETVDSFFSERTSKVITFASLAFYSFAKGYVFFTGANGLDNHIPKGTPGAILSGGMILPLNIAVGMVVACTMYGFYSLFKRGSIGHD